MSKQEEIREGLVNTICKACLPYICANWNETPKDKLSSCKCLYDWIDDIMKYLHSQGCVLKIERELPKYYCGYVEYEKDGEGIININKPIFHDCYYSFNENQKLALEKARYCATESLMEEK